MVQIGKEAAVPSPGNPDRKRVLNVLAQRRYRQRRRERIAELEAKVKNASSVQDTPLSDTTSSSHGTTPISGHEASFVDGNGAIGFDVDFDPSLEGHTCGVRKATNNDFGEESVPGLDIDWLELATRQPDDASLSWNASPQSSRTPTINTPSSSDDDLQASPTHPLASDNSSVPPLIFERGVDMPALKVLNMTVTVANMLGWTDSFWDLSFRWTLDPLSTINLPAAFQPTDAQMSIPHHPLFDLIPLPTLRTKLICVFSLPASVRPPNARDDQAMMRVVDDMEDVGEGFRIVNNDGMYEKDWEIGDAFARNWWWVLDRDIIRRTNELRLSRGAGRLLEDPNLS